MSQWTSRRKVTTTIGVMLFGMATLIGFLEWYLVPQRAMVAGEARPFEETIGVLLRTRSYPWRYLLFSPENIAGVLSTADLHFKGAGKLADVRLHADSGRVTWKTSNYGHHEVPGLQLHIQATVTPGTAATADTLVLRLPGLVPLGVQYSDDPMLAYSGSTPFPGDSAVLQWFTIYPDHAAVTRAQGPWLLFAGAMLVLLFAVIARAVIWTIT